MCGGPTQVHSKKQPLLAMHTQEAEHIEMSNGILAMRSIVNFMEELGFHRTLPIPVFEDNESACKLATERLNASRSKHIPLRCHHVKERVMKLKDFCIHWCPTKTQLADIFTKALSRANFGRSIDHVRGHKKFDYEIHCRMVPPGEW